MKRLYKIFINRSLALHLLLLIVSLQGCTKFIDVDAPSNTVNPDNAYGSDKTAISVVTGIYTNLSIENGGIYTFGSGLPLMSIYPSLSADELTIYSAAENQELVSYYKNELKANNVVSTSFWAKVYKQVFSINSAIDGLTKSTTLTPAVKNQLLGECYFLRAFHYFYLLNIYGDVPMVLSTDYTLTSLQPKISTTKVYEQIINDLKQSQVLLQDKFLDGTLLSSTEDRVRPNRAAASALLARVYLYTQDYENAEIESSTLINAIGTYDIIDLDEVFKKNSKETIWALQPVGAATERNTGEGRLFVIPPSGPTSYSNQVYLSERFLDSFESGDQRFQQWIGRTDVSGDSYYFPYKYKIGYDNVSTEEFPIILRLAEQYLIRSEARAQLNKLSLSISDLDIIRHRASLPLLAKIKPSISKSELLDAIAQERKIELFTEWGHRWLDLKRTNRINELMSIETPLKGGAWDSHDILYPIPLSDVLSNPNLVQNSGY